MEGDIDKETEIIEENNYYPFGLKHRGYNEIVNAETEHKSRFNSTEYDDDFDLNWYNMPLRHQDPTTGRWNGIDPVTHFSSSTYSGYENNPVFWADPSGADWTAFKDFVQGLVGRSRDGLVTQGYRGSFGSFAKSIVGTAAKAWASNKLSGALSPIFSRQTGNLLGFDSNGIVGPALIMDEEMFIKGEDHEETIEEGSIEIFTLDAPSLTTTKKVYDRIKNTVISLSTNVKQDIYLPDETFYKNGESVTTMSGEHYVLHDNQWLERPSSSSKNEIIENYNNDLISGTHLPTMDGIFLDVFVDGKTGGDVPIGDAYRHDKKYQTIMGQLSIRMAEHDKGVQSRRYQKAIRRKRRK